MVISPSASWMKHQQTMVIYNHADVMGYDAGGIQPLKKIPMVHRRIWKTMVIGI